MENQLENIMEGASNLLALDLESGATPVEEIPEPGTEVETEVINNIYPAPFDSTIGRAQ